MGGSKPILDFTGACPPLSLFFTFFLLSPLLEACKHSKARDDSIPGNSDDKGAKAMQVHLSYLLFRYFLLPSPAQTVMQMQEDTGRHAHGQMGGSSPPIARTWHAQAAQVCPSLSFLLFLIFSPLCESDGVQADEELMTLASITCHLK